MESNEESPRRALRETYRMSGRKTYEQCTLADWTYAVFPELERRAARDLFSRANDRGQ